MNIIFRYFYINTAHVVKNKHLNNLGDTDTQLVYLTGHVFMFNMRIVAHFVL